MHERLSQAVLDAETLRGLLQSAMLDQASVHTDEYHSSLNRSGAHVSRFRGTGLDYDDSREYQPGDNLRNINWRLVARTSSLYTKCFIEEREASIVLVIDRRASMRFGTRERLKVSRAVEMATYLAGLSLQQDLSVGLHVLQHDEHIIAPQKNIDRVFDSLMAASSACPPLDVYHQESFDTILPRIALSAPEGCQLVLFSDFQGLRSSHRAQLEQLAQRHQLRAMQILDPIELDLPESGHWLLDHWPGGHSIKINANDIALRQRYHRMVNQQQLELESMFKHCHIPFRRLLTNSHFEMLRQVLLDG